MAALSLVEVVLSQCTRWETTTATTTRCHWNLNITMLTNIFLTGSSGGGGSKSGFRAETSRQSCIQTLPCTGTLLILLLLVLMLVLTRQKVDVNSAQVTAGRTQPTAELPSPLPRFHTSASYSSSSAWSSANCQPVVGQNVSRALLELVDT